jgi:bifunctional polynucleotide phosphatase/kinase
MTMTAHFRWHLLQDSHNDSIKIDLKSSFFVGDAAGRIDGATKRRLDHSCADRLFSTNVGLRFFTPEQHFLGCTNDEPFLLPGFDPKMKNTNFNLLEPETAKLKLDEPEIIVMVGYPASGKSFFVDKHLREFGVVASSRGLLKVKEFLINNRSCVVDDRNADSKTRADLIAIAKSFKVKVRCFHMTTSYHQSRHNMEFREVSQNTWRQCSPQEFQTFESCFEVPQLTEGFDEIVRVNFVPQFDGDDEAVKLYECHLLEK